MKKQNSSKIQIVIASSKGGVGKTMIASSLIYLFARNGYKVLGVDCDVNAPNLALWLGNILQWDVIREIKVFPLAKKYEKCNELRLICDEKIIRIKKEKRGEVKIKKKYYFPFDRNLKISFVEGEIALNKTGSGKVVEETLKISDTINYEVKIVDTAPGTGYPILASLKHTNLAILVTEASILGFQDIKKLVRIVKKMGIKYGIVINRSNLDLKIMKAILKWADNSVWAQIPEDKNIKETLKEHLPLTASSLEIKNELITLYQKIVQELHL